MKDIEQQKLKSNIWKFYLFHVLNGLTFFIPIIVLFWQDNGLSLIQIMILQSLYSLTIVLLEVPSGYFADVFGRRKSLILAASFLTVGVFTYSLGHNFYQFLIAEILWGFGVSFVSGTDSALVYDTLKDLKKEKLYKKVMGNGVFYYLIATSLASVIGGFIGKLNFRWTFYAMLPFMVLLIPLSISLKEPKRHKHIYEEGYLLELFKILKNSLIKNRKIRWLVIYSAIIVGFNGAVLWLYQPYFKLTGLDVFYFGFVFAAFNLVAALSSKYAHQIEEKLGQRCSLILLVVLTAGSYLLMSNFIYLFSFSFAFIQQFVRGFSKPVITDYINKLVSSDVRATVLSAQGLMGRLFYAGIIPIIGWIADVYTLIQALTILGIITFVAGILILLILHKDRVI
ncbi:MAG: MFS transporter [Candidatus Aenigmarchaeota archaeon]|nr:MFS transporter [Candidatus Aenigmarchaeota archaeon]